MNTQGNSQKRIAKRVADFLLAPAYWLRPSRSGFTLIEAIVGATLIASAVTMAVGFFLTISKAQRKAFVESQVLDTSRYAMEVMAKALRVAEPIDTVVEAGDPEIVLLPAGPGPYTSIQFQHPMKFGTLGCPASPPCIVTFRYDLVNQKIVEENDDIANPVTPPAVFDLTGPNLIVENFQIAAQGVLPGDNVQPRLTLLLEIREQSQPASASSLTFQTSVVLRKLQQD